MIVERNGIVIFTSKEKYEDHPAVKALKKVSLGDVRFPSGFFLVEEKGKTIVIPATEEDRRKVLLAAFPNMRAEVVATSCAEHLGDDWETTCAGRCPPLHRCMRMHEERSRY